MTYQEKGIDITLREWVKRFYETYPNTDVKLYCFSYGDTYPVSCAPKHYFDKKVLESHADTLVDIDYKNISIISIYLHLS